MNVTTGSFLVARPILADPNFEKTVLLILAHGAGGAYGVVVNRPAPAKEFPVPVFLGGPCQGPGLVMLHGQAEWVDSTSAGGEEENREVAQGIFVGDAQCLTMVAKGEPGKRYRFRVFQGYAGWGPGQLDQEIAAGAWAVVQASSELLFDLAPEDQWATLSPCRIPDPSLN